VLEALEYDYDAAGNRIGQTDRLSQETGYSYDALNRLTGFDPPGEGSTEYAYDAAGNRTKAGTTIYGFNALNQVTEASNGTTYEHDGAGRLIEVDDGTQATTYSWNPLDELTSVDDGSQEVAYSYDSFGRQASRDDGSAIRWTHYGDLSDNPTLDTDAEGQPTMSYVQGPAGLIEQRTGETTSFPLQDAHGDITAILDDEGGVFSRQTYDPWGVELSGPALEMGFLGAYERRTDPATGLTQMGARPYNPILGAFIAEDPILGHLGIGITLNRYQYAGANPLLYFDLYGRDFLDGVGGVIGNAGSWTWNTAGELPGQGWDAGRQGAAAVGSGVDAAWDWTAPGRSFIGDRAQDFWKEHGSQLEDIYAFAGANWQHCRNGAVAGAAVGFVAGSLVPGVGSAVGGAAGGVAGCAGLVGANEGLKSLSR
jgi:RHS repeat-associated protein